MESIGIVKFEKDERSRNVCSAVKDTMWRHQRIEAHTARANPCRGNYAMVSRSGVPVVHERIRYVVTVSIFTGYAPIQHDKTDVFLCFSLTQFCPPNRPYPDEVSVIHEYSVGDGQVMPNVTIRNQMQSDDLVTNVFLCFGQSDWSRPER